MITQLRFSKFVPEAQLPSRAHVNDAGLDLKATSKRASRYYIEYGTGLGVEIPNGYVGLVFPRSSISQTDLSLANAVGVIDSGYRGEIKLRFRASGGEQYNVGDRIGQLVVVPIQLPQPVWERDYGAASQEDTDPDHSRGTGGFGSSGK